MRTFTLPTVRHELDPRRTPDLLRQWALALHHVPEPERRLRAVLALAAPLANASQAIVFDEDRIVASVTSSRSAQSLFARARRVLEDELIAPDLYVARLAPHRFERLALRWDAALPASVDVARAIAATCAGVVDERPAYAVPAGLPDLSDTVGRLRQLVHDARRTRRGFAVVYVAVAAAAPGERDALARSLRRAIRANDLVGYAGDDAFVVLLALESGEAEAYPAVQRLLSAAADAGVAASAGVAVCPDDGDEPQELLERAGAAAMAAASAGDDTPHWYRPTAGRALARRARVRAHICQGDPGVLFTVLYRPIVELHGGAVWGATAQAAWRADTAPCALAPRALLSAAADRPARERLEIWTIEQAAAAYRSAAGSVPPIHLELEARTDASLEAIARGFAGRHGRPALIQITGEGAQPLDVRSFRRRLRALNVAVGIGARAAASPPFDPAGALDFVTVESGDDLTTLAELAAGSVMAPAVLADGARDSTHARWLGRNGATLVRGDGIAPLMTFNELVRWASDQPGRVVP